MCNYAKKKKKSEIKVYECVQLYVNLCVKREMN